jgi:hypothetical protein
MSHSRKEKDPRDWTNSTARQRKLMSVCPNYIRKRNGPRNETTLGATIALLIFLTGSNRWKRHRVRSAAPYFRLGSAELSRLPIRKILITIKPCVSSRMINQPVPVLLLRAYAFPKPNSKVLPIPRSNRFNGRYAEIVFGVTLAPLKVGDCWPVQWEVRTAAVR